MKKIVLEKLNHMIVVDMEPYNAWLEAAKGSLPQMARDYLDGVMAGQPQTFSVHDADFVSWSLGEGPGQGSGEASKQGLSQDEGDTISTTAELVYNTWPVRVRLRYENVLHYSLCMDEDEKPSQASSLCTALLEELTLTETGLIRHEILWNNGVSVVICKDFSYTAMPDEQEERSFCYAALRMKSLLPRQDIPDETLLALRAR